MKMMAATFRIACLAATSRQGEADDG